MLRLVCSYVVVYITPDRRQSKMLLTIYELGTKITRNSVLNCHLSKWQSKTLFLTIFYLSLSIALTFSIAAQPAWRVHATVRISHVKAHIYMRSDIACVQYLSRIPHEGYFNVSPNYTFSEVTVLAINCITEINSNK